MMDGWSDRSTDAVDDDAYSRYSILMQTSVVEVQEDLDGGESGSHDPAVGNIPPK